MTLFMDDTLKKTFEDLMKKPKDWLEVSLTNDKITEWRVLILGPKGSAYENGVFEYILNFRLGVPKIIVETEMFHVNVDISQRMCLKSVDDWDWEESTAMDIINELYQLLKEPDPYMALFNR